MLQSDLRMYRIVLWLFIFLSCKEVLLLKKELYFIWMFRLLIFIRFIHFLIDLVIECPSCIIAHFIKCYYIILLINSLIIRISLYFLLYILSLTSISFGIINGFSFDWEYLCMLLCIFIGLPHPKDPFRNITSRYLLNYRII